MATISMDAVKALRKFAELIPKAITKMEVSNTNLSAKFEEVKEEVGPHEDQIHTVIKAVQKFVEESTVPIQNLPAKLNDKADEVEAYINSNLGGGQNP